MKESNDYWFDPILAEADGLVGVGGNLRPETLLRAYRCGVFPWFNKGDPILWWSPEPRAIFEIGGIHLSRRLQRTIRSGKFQTTINQDFLGVMSGCGERTEGTWVTDEMLAAYGELHRLGYAHSIEVRHEGRLVGGVYGVAVGGLFAAESMFHRMTDASKVALAALQDHLVARRFVLCDIQVPTEHTLRMGAKTISRAEYLERLAEALTHVECRFG